MKRFNFISLCRREFNFVELFDDLLDCSVVRDSRSAIHVREILSPE